MLTKSLLYLIFACVAFVRGQNSEFAGALLLGLLLTVDRAAGGTNACVPYTGEICAPYVNYTVYTGNATVDMIEKQLAPIQQLKEQLGAIDPTCVDQYFRYACSFYLPKCGSGTTQEQTVWMGCESTCKDISDVCGNIFTFTGQSSLLPDCAAVSPTTHSTLQPDESCNYISAQVSKEDAGLHLAAVPAGFVMADCPAPFIRDPKAKQGSADTENELYCRFGCCMPCPAQDLFFKEGWTTHAFLATNIVRFISAVASFILVVSYLVLPDKRRHPSLLILNFSMAIFLFSMVVFFSIGDTKGLQCSDAINPSTQDNNALCGAQGAILIFAALSTVLWCAALIINLHVHTVWNSSYLADKYWLLGGFCWGVPAVFMAVTLGLHQVKFEFANLCLVSVEYIFDLFFYPMAAIICPAFIVHCVTFLYIARVAIKESQQSELSQSFSQNSIGNRNQLAVRRHKHILSAFKIQWRALLLAVVAIVTVLFYWIFYFTQIDRMANIKTDNETILAWLGCMLSSGNGQDACTYIVDPHLPPFGLMITAEALVSLIGVWIFLIFGKRSLWREWNDLIYDIRLSLSSQNRHEKNGEQFFAL